MHAYIDMAHFNTDLVSIFCKSNHGVYIQFYCNNIKGILQKRKKKREENCVKKVTWTKLCRKGTCTVQHQYQTNCKLNKCYLWQSKDQKKKVSSRKFIQSHFRHTALKPWQTIPPVFYAHFKVKIRDSLLQMQSIPEASADNFLNFKPKTINKHQAKHKTFCTAIHISYTQFDTFKLLRKAFLLFYL